MFLSRVHSSFQDFCYIFDFFKTPFSFHYSKEQRLVSSKFGTFLSLLIISYLISSFINSNMYLKTNPSVYTQMVYNKYHPEIHLDKTNFEIAFGIFDNSLKNFEYDHSIFEINIVQINIYHDQDNNLFTEAIIKPNHNCTEADLTVSHLPVIYPYMVCLDNLTLDLKGSLNEPTLSYFAFQFDICNNLTTNNHCKSNEEIENYLNGKFVGLHYSDYNINFNDFENPIFPTHQTESIWLDVRNAKSMNVYLKKFEFLDDYDYIGSHISKTEKFTKDTTMSDFTMAGTEPLAIFRFLISQEVQESKRVYQKLTDVLANIGGTASLLISIGFILVNLFINWQMRFHFFDHLYDLNKNINDDGFTQNDNNIFQSPKLQTCVTRSEFLKNNIDIEIFQQSNEKTTNNSAKKPKVKALKEDSFILERYSKEKLGQNNNKKRKIQLNFIKNLLFKIKTIFGCKITESDQIYSFIDEGYDVIMNGNFIYKKMQELELLKKIMLNEKQLFLFERIAEKKPSLDLRFEISKIKLKENNFNLFPIPEIDDKTKLYQNKKIINEKLVVETSKDDKIEEKLVSIYSKLI